MATMIRDGMMKKMIISILERMDIKLKMELIVMATRWVRVRQSGDHLNIMELPFILLTNLMGSRYSSR